MIKNFFTFYQITPFKNEQKKIKLALYYPSYFELNVLKILEFENILGQDILLPVTDKKNLMNFFPWKKMMF